MEAGDTLQYLDIENMKPFGVYTQQIHLGKRLL